MLSKHREVHEALAHNIDEIVKSYVKDKDLKEYIELIM
jgi:hypothetical protein